VLGGLDGEEGLDEGGGEEEEEGDVGDGGGEGVCGGGEGLHSVSEDVYVGGGVCVCVCV
jgi:hypothetical protein